MGSKKIVDNIFGKLLASNLKVSAIFYAPLLAILGILAYTGVVAILPTQGILTSFLSSREAFQYYFPKHFELAYSLIFYSRIMVIPIVLILAWLINRNRSKLESFLRKQRTISLKYFCLSALLTTFIWLVIILGIYFWSLTSLKPEIHSNFQVWLAVGWLSYFIGLVGFTVLVHFQSIKKWFKEFLLEPTQPYNLAILRILFGLWSIRVYFEKLEFMLPTVGLEHRVGLPLIGWLVDVLPISTEIYTMAVYAATFCCVLIVLGVKTRLALVLNAILCFYIIAVPNFFGKLWHDQLIIWISWLLAISRCYDVLSVDAMFRKEPVLQSGNYTFPVRLVWLQFGIIYFWAGFYKLWDCGFDWALSDSMVNQLQLEWLQNYNRIPDLRWDNWPWLVKLSGMLVILFELSYIFMILFRTTRWIAVAGALFMHRMIRVVLYISFWQSLQVFYLSYFNFNWLVPNRFCKKEISTSYSKTALGFGVALLSINFVFGMLSVDSYPFSAYPKYAALIPDEVEYIHFEAKSTHGNWMKVYEIGEENQFKWENYGWLEHGIIRDYKKGEDTDQRLKDYWEIWTAHNKELQNCDSVSAYLIKRPVSPEGILQADTLALISNVLP